MRFRTSLLALVLAATASCAPVFLGAPRTDPDLYPEPPENAITFWGHATSYIDVGGVGIVTDPVFEKAYSPFHARRIPVPPRTAYDQTSIILISHAHRDHLHPKSLARFSPGTVVLCPESAAGLASGLELQVRVMRPGDEYTFSGGTIVAVAAHHPGGRNSLKARHDGGALGYVVHTAEHTIYYSGDTEYFEGFAEVRREHAPDIVILNINAHLNSYEAVLAVGELGYPLVVPTHFGAYGGSNARNSPSWRAELVRLLGDVVMPLEVGESLDLSALPAAFLAGDAGPNRRRSGALPPAREAGRP